MSNDDEEFCDSQEELASACMRDAPSPFVGSVMMKQIVTAAQGLRILNIRPLCKQIMNGVRQEHEWTRERALAHDCGIESAGTKVSNPARTRAKATLNPAFVALLFNFKGKHNTIALIATFTALEPQVMRVVARPAQAARVEDAGELL